MTKKIAIIGAGPIGIEAALHATHLGYDVTIYERHQTAHHITRWSHVTFFSPWPLNTTPLGLSTLKTAAITTDFPPDTYPTAQQYLDQYLLPLSQTPPLHNKIKENTNVLAIARKNTLKPELTNHPDRADQPFTLLIEQNGLQKYTEADIVIDTTGTLANPNELGPGGLPLPNQHALNHLIERHIPKILTTDRARYTNQHTLVIGAGFSAATTLKMLHELQQIAPKTKISWLFRSPPAPYEVIPNDPLPQRQRLTTFANLTSHGKTPGITPIPNATITHITPSPENTIKIDFLHNHHPTSLQVDKVISNIGYKPDTDLYRELQVHLCYATEGPMKLAASLLASNNATSTSADCLQQASPGPQTLLNPEPNFFVLGTKSYGRSSNFILKIGFQQIHDLFTNILPSPKK